MSNIDIAAIRALAEKATPGPWASDGYEVLEGPEDDVWVVAKAETASGWCQSEDNAEFIAASRAIVPQLCDEVERLRAANGRLNIELDRAGDVYDRDTAKLRADLAATKERLAAAERVVEAARREVDWDRARIEYENCGTGAAYSTRVALDEAADAAFVVWQDGEKTKDALAAYDAIAGEKAGAK